MTNCVYAGTFTGSGSRASPSVACPGDLITFSAWVVDSGGTVTIMNTDGDCNVTTTTNSVSATPQWTWSVNGCSDSSRGQVCSVAFELPNPGTYTCNFTATVANCPDNPIQMNLSASATVVGWVVSNVSFTGSSEFNVLQDNGSGPYSAPHWTPTNSSPVLYVANTTGAVTAVFAVAAPTNFACSQLYVRGDGSGGLNIPATTCTVAGVTATLTANFAAPFANQVGFLNPLTINWKCSGDGINFYDAGSSTNPVYVTLTNPATANLFRTVVHLACSNPGATTSNTAVANTWALFAGRNVTTWGGTNLIYYQAGISWANNVTNVAGLLSTGNGQCNAWRELLESAWLANGVNSEMATVSTVVNPGSRIFLVKNWVFGTPTLTNDPPFNYLFLLNASNGSMVGVGNYGDLQNGSGAPGQNSATPAEKAFGYHFIQKLNNTYYDPSYGTNYTGAADFQTTAVAGYGEINPDNPNTNFPGMMELGVTQVTNTVVIKIVP